MNALLRLVRRFAPFILTAGITLASAPLANAQTSASTLRITTAAPAPVGHVFVIVLENKNESSSFGLFSKAPYLSKTLTSMGAFVPNYYGIGHHSLDNYIAMISGQPPDAATKADCGTFTDFVSTGTQQPYSLEIGNGCVYPAHVSTLAQQLDAANLSWRGYMEDMGNDPSREAATCSHPAIGATDNTQSATATDQYATRHNPFMYFHSIIDNQPYCDQHVVNLGALNTDLQQIATTPNFTFITPDLCHDGHDRSCADGGDGGLKAANTFLQQWVPLILQSPAYLQDGLLIVTFDEAETSSAACCGEESGPNVKYPGGLFGKGGGKVGAVMVSRFIKPGTETKTAYNHYSLLRSLEDIYGVGYLGYAGQTGLQGFGGDVFTNPSGN
jgi:hypothetical protein